MQPANEPMAPIDRVVLHGIFDVLYVKKHGNDLFVKVPHELKDKFRAVFPKAKWQSHFAMWRISAKSEQRVKDWIDEYAEEAQKIEKKKGLVDGTPNQIAFLKTLISVMQEFYDNTNYGDEKDRNAVLALAALCEGNLKKALVFLEDVPGWFMPGLTSEDELQAGIRLDASRAIAILKEIAEQAEEELFDKLDDKKVEKIVNLYKSYKTKKSW